MRQDLFGYLILTVVLKHTFLIQRAIQVERDHTTKHILFASTNLRPEFYYYATIALI